LKKKDELFVNKNEYKFDYKAPCYNDECVFITNDSFFPKPDFIQFGDDELSTVPLVKEYEKGFYQSDKFPKEEVWLKFAYHHVVDNDIETSWRSSNFGKNNYFGLDLLNVKKVKKIKILMGKYFGNDLKLFVSNDNLNWKNVDFRKEFNVDEKNIYLSDLEFRFFRIFLDIKDDDFLVLELKEIIVS
jgi:hypothetical protein